MVKPLTNENLAELIGEQGHWCVSLYMPTHRSLPEAKQDPIRFKNLLRNAGSELEAKGLRASEIEEFLKPAQTLLGDPLFWRYQSDGLAAFLSANGFRSYRLPLSLKELSIVGDHFHIKPLLPLLRNDRFLVLALSKNAIRLIEGTRYGASEVELENVPGSLTEVMGNYEFEEQLQFHTRAPQAGNGRAAVFHGQGSGIDDLKPRISEYFRRIDEGLRATLKDKQLPLVIAGVESLFPIYSEVNTYGKLLEEGIAGNPDLLSAEQLRQRAWEIVEPVFLSAREDAENRYHALAGTGRTSNDLREVVMAAYDGRVDVLLVTVGVQVWGRFNNEKRSVAAHEQRQPDDRDLLDICVVNTLMNRGSVYPVEPDGVPGNGLVAAVFRY